MRKLHIQSFRIPSVGNRIRAIRQSTKYAQFQRFLQNRPFTSFFAALALVFVAIAAGSFIASQKKDVVTESHPVKSVDIVKIGDTPQLTLQANIDKKGVIQIVSQTAGIVQRVHKHEGDAVYKGTQIISLSSNYQGGNAQSVQRQLAQVTYKNITDTYDAQKELIQKQRDVAEKTEENNEDLRDIARRSLDDTRGMLTTSEIILNSLRENLQTLQTGNVDGTNDAMVLQTQQLVSQSEGGVNQLRASIRQLELQSDTDDPQIELQGLQKDITLKQLEIQEKTLDMNREVSRLQVSLAAIAEATMYPASPVTGTVERVLVSVGDSVTPGTVLAVISGTDETIIATVQVPRSVALTASRAEASTLHLNGKTASIVPYYVSANATDETLYTMFYTIEPEFASDISNNEYVKIDVPLSTMQKESTFSYVPIDSVYQTQESAHVFVVEQNKAVIRQITLGLVYGRYVQVKSGLKANDQVIINRNVLAGDQVRVR